MTARFALSRALANYSTGARQVSGNISKHFIKQLSTSGGVHLHQEAAHIRGEQVQQANDVFESTHSSMTTAFNASDKRTQGPSTTSRLHFIEPAQVPTVASYSVLNQDGSLVSGHQMDPELTPDKIVQLYVDMVKLNAMDKVMFDSQRQGRISFYMTNFGEEGAQVGSAAALSQADWVFAQYREAGVLIHRQMPLKLMLAQCYGNKEDLGKGRQMPIHYGNRQLNFVTLSSTLTTQLPQAAGAAYALKMKAKAAAGMQSNDKADGDDDHDRIVMCYFGEGAASEGDAHAAMNFAATLACPVVFFCRNNGYAISTPSSEQFASDGIVHRGLGYGMSSIRVDGNDLFAVFEATKKARQLSKLESRPVLVEAMTYRVGHHSTSDDSLAYRSAAEVASWSEQASAIKRVQSYLLANKLWSDEQEQQAQQAARNEVIEALNWAERVKKLPIESMFDDVYDKLPSHIERQRSELARHLEKYGQHYPIDQYESSSSS